MTKPKDMFGELIGEVIAQVIGWIYCMVIASGFYAIGYWLAPYFSGGDHRDSFGLLSAVVMIWLYESARSRSRWEALNSRLDHLAEQRMHRY